MDYFIDIQKPTLVLNEERARANITRMAEKARANGVRLRPHFKTHQSAAIGDWFEAAGVRCITVSSAPGCRNARMSELAPIDSIGGRLAGSKEASAAGAFA